MTRTWAEFSYNEEDVKVIGIACDVSSELSVKASFAKIMEMFGRIDAVVASAGG